MKIIIPFLFAIAISASMTGCGDADSDNKEMTTTQPTTANSEAEETATITSTATVAKIDTNRKTDIRKTCWGDSKEDVKLLENDKPTDESEKDLVYTALINGVSTSIMYKFNDNDQLFSVFYYSDDKDGRQPKEMVSDYNELKDTICEKYGDPSYSDVVVLNDLHEYATEAESIQLGYSRFISMWETNSTEGSLVLSNSNYTIKLMATFTSKEIDQPQKDSEPVI
ncbi:MAG: hypothetical protein IJR91_07685 [Ruminococcus sp.]|nr:hypothetical protein [Ruminococcus sp.]